jgi:flagellar biosynthesis/type III secretory pathway M-ring protein FliF/YscJ
MKPGSDDDALTSGPAQDPFAEDDTGNDDDEPSAAETASVSSAKPTLPYIHRRDSVKEDRNQRPMFLRPDTESGIDDLIDDVETDLGEDVYKTDVTEAAMVVAQRNPELVADVLREWGYDYE